MKNKNKKACYKVLKYYGLEKDNISLITDAKKGENNRNIKVWIVYDRNNKPTYVLKRLRYSRSLFSILLQHQLFKSGFGVPKVYKTVKGILYVNYKNRHYFLQKFIPDLSPLTTKKRIEALAKFHKAAHFANLPVTKKTIKYKNKEGFLKSYSRKLNKLKKCKDLTKSPTQKKIVKEMIKHGEESIKILQRCKLNSYLKNSSKHYSICHGDFHSRNSFLTKQGKFLIIDLDLAYYGHTVDDFRHLMTLLTTKENSNNRLKKLFKYYFKYLPKDKKYRIIFLADTKFPHEFYKFIAKNKRIDFNKKNDEITDIIDRERRRYQLAQKESTS